MVVQGQRGRQRAAVVGETRLHSHPICNTRIPIMLIITVSAGAITLTETVVLIIAEVGVDMVMVTVIAIR